MKLHLLCILIDLGALVLAQGKRNSKDDNQNIYCGPEFKKRDCAEPFDFEDEGLGDGDDGLNRSPPDQPKRRSVVRRDLGGLFREDELQDADLVHRLGRDILLDLAAGENDDVLVERIVANTESLEDVLSRLEVWYQLSHDLEKRAARKVSWEGKEDIDNKKKKPDGYYYFCEKEGSLLYKTSPYEEGVTLYDNADWSRCDNYQLEKGGTKHSSRNKGKKGEGDGYITEHVLERQMIQQFARARLEKTNLPDDDTKGGNIVEDEDDDDGKGDKDDKGDTGGSAGGQTGTYCGYMSRYWEGIGLTHPNNEAQVLITDPASQELMPPLYVVGQAWPKPKVNNNEMLVFERYANGAKARVFKNGTKINADNHFLLHKGGKPKGLTDLEKAHALLKTSVLVAKYMAHEDVQKIYKDQGDRVAEAWKTAEDGVQQYWAGRSDPYKPLGLDTMWRTWIRSYTDTVREKLWGDIKKWDSVFSNQIKRFDEALQKLRKDTKVHKKDLPHAQRKLWNELKAARAEIERLETVGKDKLFGNLWA